MYQDKKIEICRSSYENYYIQQSRIDFSGKLAVEKFAHRFLAGKPFVKGLSHSNRSIAFWACDFWQNVSADCFEEDAVVIALSRSLPCGAPDPEILERILSTAPGSLKRAIRYSQLFLLPESTHWASIEQLSFTTTNEDFKLFIALCNSIREARDKMIVPVEELQAQVAELTVLDILMYSSLFTFQNIISDHCEEPELDGELREWEEETWYAMNQILAWKLKTRPESDFQVTEQSLAESLKEHIAPLLFPSRLSTSTCTRNLQLFSKLIVAQLEYNEFLTTTVETFSFDDLCDYRIKDDSIELFKLDDTHWERNQLKLGALHRYWFNRALIETHFSGALHQTFGKPENDHANRLAYIRATQVFLQLEEVYGLNGRIDVSDDVSVDLVRAIHSLELMTAFFNNDFIEPFKAFYRDCGHWCEALFLLAKDGLQNNLQNRFPLTWAEPEVKAQRIKSWTVSDQHPEGDIEEARAILDFWTHDLEELAKHLKGNINIPVPELHERPILRLGQYGFQLPWLTAAQNNSTAAINNLRRLGSRHKARGEETRRIEHRLGEQLKTKGFLVVHGFRPEVNPGNDPGEVDLICFLEGHLFIFEVKSTYLRKTQQEAWLHRTNALRKAGQQLKHKQVAVKEALAKDEALRDNLHIKDHTEIVAVHAWIVDTSIEYDQEIIDGFHKVSLEALIIVLRNEQFLLRYSILQSLLSAEGEDSSCFSDLFEQYETGAKRKDDLFPQGFTARRFAEIIERGELWQVLDELE